MRHLFLLLLVACAGTQTTPVAQETTPDGLVVAADPFALPPGAADSAATVELVSAGSTGEAELIRLHPREGFTQRMIMSMTMSMAMDMGVPMPTVEMPTSHMIFAVRVVNTNEDGLTRRELLLEEIRVDPGEHAAAMEAELLPLQGLRGVEIVDSRGRTLYLAYDIPEGVSDATRASLVRMQDVMKQVQPPFPIEPVAVGARWRVASEIRNQVVMQQVQEYELVEREGDHIVLQVVTTQSAQPQVMEVPQPGVSARLLSLVGEGTGRSEINLTQIAPNAVADVRVELQSEIIPDGQPMVSMMMTTRVHLETAPR
ncbi:MAG: hypothetical protein ACI9KE_002018 [Polyangiales bacterium]|jgi:hypothetical protein